MAENPTTEGPVKSLRQVTPGGDVAAALFGLIALLIAIGLVRNAPTGPTILVNMAFILVFAVPAYVLYASSRGSGVFVTDERVEYHVLGRPRVGWPRSEVGSIEPISGGLLVRGLNGQVLRHFKFRWWSTEQGARFARASGLTPASAHQVDPGEPGNGR